MNYTCFDQSLRQKIRGLMLYHSSQELYETMNSIFQEDYAFYRTLYSVPEAAVPEAAVPEAAVPEAAVPEVAVPEAAVPEVVVPEPEAEAPPHKIPSNTKIRIIKRDLPTVSVSLVDEKERKALIKREQGEKEAEKNAELVLKGVDPESLLTKANLKKWIEVDKLTYTQIARDHVGLSSAQIAAVAKGFGFQSPIAKKRIIAANYKK